MESVLEMLGKSDVSLPLLLAYPYYVIRIERQLIGSTAWRGLFTFRLFLTPV